MPEPSVPHGTGITPRPEGLKANAHNSLTNPFLLIVVQAGQRNFSGLWAAESPSTMGRGREDRSRSASGPLAKNKKTPACAGVFCGSAGSTVSGGLSRKPIHRRITKNYRTIRLGRRPSPVSCPNHLKTISNKAEGKGFEPSTPFGASDFESDRWPIRIPSSRTRILDRPAVVLKIRPCPPLILHSSGRPGESGRVCWFFAKHRDS